MTADEFKKRIAEATENAEKMPALLADLVKDVESDYAEKATLMDRVADLEKKNSELHDTNMKLYLAQVGNPENNDADRVDEELTGMDAVNKFFDNLQKEGGN